MIKLKNGTPEEKLAQVEKILNRMQRKLHKTVIGVMPPIPIMLSAEEPNPDGEIFKILIPASGKITAVCLCVKEIEGKEAATFEALIVGPDAGSFIRFATKKLLTIQKTDINVAPGDMLILKTDNPERVHGIWLALLYQMGIKESGKERFLIEELEKILDEDAKVIEEGQEM